MAADPDNRNPGDNVPVFSVSEISTALKSTVEETFSRVRVRGEISGFKRAASGHCYMSLKDADAVLDAVCWRTMASRLAIAPEDGLEVIASGRLTTYPGRSKYQIVIDTLELAGEGALLKLLEERRRALAAEGLFDEDRKRPIPFVPEVIGIVTSPTGAAVRDILHRLADRFPRPVYLWPVIVQGEGAAAQIAAAIRGFSALPESGGPIRRPDLLIVGRGGGSLEDLWAFNEEVVVRAVADCTIPLIAAVGHETDWTLIDLVADRRAPTPTAAAEMAVPVRSELAAQLMDDGRRLYQCVWRFVERWRRELEGFARGLPNLRRMLDDRRQRADEWSERLANALKVGLERRRGRLPQKLPSPRPLVRQKRQQLQGESRALGAAYASTVRSARQRLDALGQLLESYSYERVLDRGFALVEGPGGPVTRAEGLAAGTDVAIRFSDGAVGARVTGGGPPREKPKPKTASRRTKKDADGRQGSLL